MSPTNLTTSCARKGRPIRWSIPGMGGGWERAQIDVRRREDLCRGKLQSSRDVDLQNSCMRIVGADEHRMQRTR